MSEKPARTVSTGDGGHAVSGTLRKRLQVAGGLVAAGLLIEAITLSWSHPFSFMTFIFVSGTLVAAGVLLYLWTVVSQAPGG